MRVTTQMLNDSARRAGLPIDNSSVMNYMKSGNKSSLLNPVQNTGNIAKLKSIKSNYEKQGKAAEDLLSQTEKLSNADKDNIFAKAEETGDTSEICKTAEKLVDEYNSLLGVLDKSDGLLDNFYKQNLKDIVSKNKEALADVGITAKKDGSLKVDSDKLKGASLDDLNKAFGGESDFIAKIQFLAGRVADNAEANVKSATSNYSQNGSMNYYTSNKYDFLG